MELGATTTFIEAPGSDAWQSYDDIHKKLITALQHHHNKEDSLILVSMGSAAKVLVYDMSLLGYTAWDTGQFFDLAFTEIQKMKNL